MNDSIFPETKLSDGPGVQTYLKTGGLTKLELFSALILAGVVLNPTPITKEQSKDIVPFSVRMAKALIEELKKNE